VLCAASQRAAADTHQFPGVNTDSPWVVTVTVEGENLEYGNSTLIGVARFLLYAGDSTVSVSVRASYTGPNAAEGAKPRVTLTSGHENWTYDSESDLYHHKPIDLQQVPSEQRYVSMGFQMEIDTKPGTQEPVDLFSGNIRFMPRLYVGIDASRGPHEAFLEAGVRSYRWENDTGLTLVVSNTPLESLAVEIVDSGVFSISSRIQTGKAIDTDPTGRADVRVVASLAENFDQYGHITDEVAFDVTSDRYYSGTRYRVKSIVRLPFGRVSFVDGSCYWRKDADHDWKELKQGTVLAPPNWVYVGKWFSIASLSRVGIDFCDGRRCILHTSHFGTTAEIGKELENHRLAAWVNLQDLPYDIARNPVSWGVYVFSKGAGKLTQVLLPGGWIVSRVVGSGTGNLLKYSLTPVQEENGGTKTGRMVANDVTSERDQHVTMTLFSDGTVTFENAGGPIDIAGPQNTITLPSGAMTMDDPAGLTPFSDLAASSLGADEGPVNPSLTPRDGANVSTRRPDVYVTFPGADSNDVASGSLECRVNGVLTLSRMETNGMAYVETGTLPDGPCTVDAAFTSLGGVRTTTGTTFTVDGAVSPPRWLTATGGASTVGLRWNRVLDYDLDGYRVFRSSASNGAYAELTGNLIKQPAFLDDSPLSHGFYKVRAVSTDGEESSFSTVADAVPGGAGATPPPVTNLTATQSDAGVVIEFDDDADPYVVWSIERSSAGGPFADVLAGERVWEAGTIDTTVTLGQSYTYRVTPYGLDGQVGTSAVSASVTVVDTSPDAPGGLTVYVDESNVAHLRWDPHRAGDVTLFNVYRDSGPGYAVIGTRPAGVTTYSDGPLAPGAHSWKVTAQDAAAQEGAGTIVHANWWRAGGPAGSFQFASGFQQIMKASGEAALTVTRTGGSSGGAFVQYGTEDDTAVAGVDYAPRGGTLIFAQGEESKAIRVPLLPGAGFSRFKVKLFAVLGGGTLGSPATTTIALMAGGLAAPAALNATAGTSAGSVDLTWSPVAGATSYGVWWSRTPQVGTAERIATGVTTTSYGDRGAVPSVHGYYWVRGLSASSVGAYSAAAEGWRGGSVPVVEEMGIAIDGREMSLSAWSLENRLYRVQMAPSLDGAWEDLPGFPEVDGTGRLIDCVRFGTALDQGYFRLRIRDRE